MLNFAKIYFIEGTSAPASSSTTNIIQKKMETLKKKKRGREDSVTWGWVTLVQKIKFTKIPLQAPLTKIHDPEDHNTAVELFKGS